MTKRTTSLDSTKSRRHVATRDLPILFPVKREKASTNVFLSNQQSRTLTQSQHVLQRGNTDPMPPWFGSVTRVKPLVELMYLSASYLTLLLTLPLSWVSFVTQFSSVVVGWNLERKNKDGAVVKLRLCS